MTLSGVIIAILAPLSGCWLELVSRKRALLMVLTFGCVVATGLLFFARPDARWLWYALGLVVFAEVCYELAIIAYNSLLLLVASKENYGRISGWGWGAGYLGGMIVLALSLLIVNQGWPSQHDALNVRATTLVCAIWFFLFSLPLFRVLPKRLGAMSKPTSWSIYFDSLRNTFREILRRKPLFWLLVTRLFAMDGLNTLFAFGGIYAAGTFGFSMQSVLLFAILLNVTAGIGAFLLGWLDDILSPLVIIIVSLIGLIVFSSISMLTHSVTVFWATAAGIGFFVGPVQSSTRSYLAHQVGGDDAYRLFGFYSFSGRISAFIGPMLFGVFVTWTGTQRAGVGVVVLLLIIALVSALRLGVVDRRTTSSKA